MKQASPVLAALLLSGCASMKLPETPSCASREACQVTVTVRGCSWKNIEAAPEVLKVRRGYKGDIEWKLVAPPGWQFAENGIEFKDAKNPEFDKARRSARAFAWYDSNTKPGAHHYNINVIPPEGGKPCTRDPTIMNGEEP